MWWKILFYRIPQFIYESKSERIIEIGPHLCCVGEPFWAHQNAKNLLVAGAPPRTPLGELTALPKPPSWWGGAPLGGFADPLHKNPTYNIVIVLVLLCVCTHVYENALLFLS